MLGRSFQNASIRNKFRVLVLAISAVAVVGSLIVALQQASRATHREADAVTSRNDAVEQKRIAEQRLWESKLGTPDGDRFEVLVTLIEAYEDEHYPMPMGSDPSPPCARK